MSQFPSTTPTAPPPTKKKRLPLCKPSLWENRKVRIFLGKGESPHGEQVTAQMWEQVQQHIFHSIYQQCSTERKKKLSIFSLYCICINKSERDTKETNKIGIWDWGRGWGGQTRVEIGVRIFTMHPFILFDLYYLMWIYYLFQTVKAIRFKKKKFPSCHSYFVRTKESKSEAV